MPRLPQVVAASGAPAPFARQLERLTRLLGHAEYDPEHQVLLIRRADTTRLISGQLFEIEIYLQHGLQPRLYRGYVRDVTAIGATFRGRRLAPLTKAGLKRAIRDAKRKPSLAAGIAMMRNSTARAEAAIDDALAVIAQSGRKWLDRRDAGRI